MDIVVVGRHALLFDDDTTAAFVNSNDALVEWNSLLIDRYDVRHLLSSPPPPRRRRNQQQTHSSSADAELDYERYLDLPSPSDEPEADAKPETAGGFNAVPFSYRNSKDSDDQKNDESGLECAFHPPFPIPDSLIQKLPPTEKIHQIIARTALFVSRNGGQSEIVLRVKQGGNPTFGFLMPDHHLHAYFRFLVDHQDLLQSKDNGQTENEETTSNTGNGAGAGALSLLGSIYGTGEDEDGATENVPLPRESVTGNTVGVDASSSLASQKVVSPSNRDGKVESVSKHSLPSKEETPASRRNFLTNAPKAGSTSGVRKGEPLGSLTSAPNKLRASSLPPIPKTERLLVEPPLDLKRLVDKIVEFVMKNGRQFEAVLMEQDREHGRFPFLIPSNKYHPYYLKVLQKAQEPKLTGKSFHNEKEDLRGHVSSKKSSISKENETLSVESADIPFDFDRKEKFKMVIGKSKKEGTDLTSKPTEQQIEVRVDAAQAAAILQAATRGIKHPNLGILSNTSLNGNSHGTGSEGAHPSNSSQPESLPKAIAKTAAKEVASEADSSEACLTQEQKLKAERLKRAKMFVAMLKSGAAPSKAELSHGLSVEPLGSGASGFDADVSFAAKEREGSSAPSDLDVLDKSLEPEKEHLTNERRSKRKYRARSSRYEDDVGEEDEEEEEERRSFKHRRKKHHARSSLFEYDSKEEKDEKRGDYDHGKKKHRSHRSSRRRDFKEEDSEEEKDHKSSRKKKHLSPSLCIEDKEQETEGERGLDSIKKNENPSRRSSHVDGGSGDEHESDHKYSRKKHYSSREGDDRRDEKHSRRKHRSHRSSHRSRDRHKHRRSHSSRHGNKHDLSSEEELRPSIKAEKHRKEAHSEREELEEGEISSKISDQSRGGYMRDAASREPSVDISSLYQDQRTPSQPSDTTEVPDDLRAKIRAMLMSTL